MSQSDDAHILREKNQKTLYFALLLLFFFQLFGRWIESIYRLSLIKLEPGLEVAGLLLFLYALVFLVVPKKKESLFLKGSVFLFLLLRFLCPFLPIRIQVIAAGLGVANFLILYAAWLSKPYRHLQGDAGYAIILSILSYILLRSLGYSVDISMDGSSVLACAALVAMAVYFTWRHFAPQECEEELTEKQENEPSGCWMDVLSAFGNFALVVFFFSAPHTLACWFGYEDAHLPGRYYVSALLIWLVVTDTKKLSLHSEKRNIIYNVLFAGLLVSCLILGRPQLPATVTDVNTIALYEPPNFLLIFSFIIALVLPVNIRQIQARCTFPDPQAALLRVVPTFFFSADSGLAVNNHQCMGLCARGHLITKPLLSSLSSHGSQFDASLEEGCNSIDPSTAWHTRAHCIYSSGRFHFWPSVGSNGLYPPGNNVRQKKPAHRHL